MKKTQRLITAAALSVAVLAMAGAEPVASQEAASVTVTAGEVREVQKTTANDSWSILKVSGRYADSLVPSVHTWPQALPVPDPFQNLWLTFPGTIDPAETDRVLDTCLQLGLLAQAKPAVYRLMIWFNVPDGEVNLELESTGLKVTMPPGYRVTCALKRVVW